jgi:hypothetical protein
LEASDSGASDMKNIRKFWKLNELVFEYMLLSVNYSTRSGKFTFNLVDKYVSSDQKDKNCKLALERLSNKYQPKIAPSYIESEKDFTNSKCRSVLERPNTLMTNLESEDQK